MKFFESVQTIKYYIPLERKFNSEQLFCLQLFLKMKPIKVTGSGSGGVTSSIFLKIFVRLQTPKCYISLERKFHAEQLFCLQFFLKIKPIKVMMFFCDVIKIRNKGEFIMNSDSQPKYV